MKRPIVLCIIVACLCLCMPLAAQSVNCSGVAAWSANSVPYAVGNLVTYNGSEYKCIQANTSQTGWDPVSAPSLWSLVGTCGTGGTNPTPTATPASGEGPYGGTAAAIPGTVQAENYDTGGQGVGYSVASVNGSGNSYRSDGVDLETTTDTGGGYDVGWTATGQWFRYTVNVASAGTYNVSFRVAAPSAVTDGFHLSNSSGTNLSGNINIAATGGWQTWVTVTATVTLPAGQQTLTLNQDNGGWNFNYMSFALASSAFGGTPAAIPGTVQAENYDTGGQGQGYSVASANGSANSYRSDGVDLETTTDTGGGYDVGWTASAQWFHYTVNVASAGTYTVSFRIAAPTAVTDGFHISNSSGANLSGNVNVPATGGWQIWATVTANVTLPAGQQVLTLNQDNGGWNINYVSFAAVVTATPTPTPTPTATATATVNPGGAFGGTPAAIPGTVQAENYDLGGQGTGYSVTSVNGSANTYRSDGVDLETTTDTGGGYDLGWTATGQWFHYTVKVAAAGTYSVSFRIASPNAVTDGFHLSNSSGANLSGNVNVPATGGYQTWTTVTTTVTLPAGQQVLTLNQDNGGWNINYISFVSPGNAFGGSPAAIPGTVQAENYDIGGQGQGYSVASVNGSANTYRSDGVDLETTTDAGGGYDLGWTASGQWFHYTVNVASAGTYTVSFRITAPTAVTDGLHLSSSSGTNLTGNVNIPATGGWQNWQTVTATLTLPAGQQVLTLNQDNGGWNINYMSFTSGSAPPPPPNFGPNVLIFDPSMSSSTIQSQLDNVFNTMQSNQFGNDRYALLFKPGTYNNTVRVGFFTQVLGLGQSPDNTLINGYVQADAQWFQSGNATQNFWRGAENLAVNPSASSGTDMWAVSQACPWRRMHIKGNVILDDNGGWSSGGFISDSVIDNQINSGTQQQFLTRNDQWGSWTGSSFNMVFVGDVNAPGQSFPNPDYTTVGQTPVVREKPFLMVDSSGNYNVFVPALRNNSSGTTWSSGPAAGNTIPISQFYIAQSSTDTAASINNALSQGLNLILTPGVYSLTQPINITRANTVVLGLGIATLLAQNGTTAMTVSDVDGVIIAGILFDAGSTNSPVLLQVGSPGSSASHASNPISLHDLFFRVGGAAAGAASVSLQINSNNVIGDDFWIWRADHSYGVGWNTNPAANGLVVNGNNVTIYGLAVEHYEQYQTLWNGNGGQVYFYQSEDPYDVPNQGSWMAGSENGYASYKVADSVTSHQAWGVGVYCLFTNYVLQQNAFEAPNNSGIQFHDLFTWYIGNQGGISNVINNTGGSVTSAGQTAKMTQYP